MRSPEPRQAAPFDAEHGAFKTSSPLWQHPLAYLLGLEGVALLGAFAGEHGRDFVGARLAEIRGLLASADGLGEGTSVAPMPVVDGYDGWASYYDDQDNQLIDIEEPIVQRLIDRLPAGLAVDAACGTGRHAGYLAARGHRVVGFDTSPAMLNVAKAKVATGGFAIADLRHLPVPDGAADLVVCALALAHLPELAPAFTEFARALRPGGHLVVSDSRGHFIGSTRYPLVKWGTNGQPGYIPTWSHPTSAYLRAALDAGLTVRDCVEPPRPWPIVEPAEPAEPSTCAGPPNIWALQRAAPDAANAVYRDHPIAIIWHLQRLPIR